MSLVSFVVFPDILRVAVKIFLPDVLFDLMRVLPVEWISFGRKIVEAATKGPDIRLRRQVVLLATLEDFWC